MNATGAHYTTQQELEECQWLKLPGQSTIIPNGLDIDRWQPNPAGAKQWRKENGLSLDDIVLLNVGRLHHKKGLDLLPQVLAPLKHLSWKLVLVGDDNDGTKLNLQQSFQSLALLDRVLFLPACSPDQLPAIYSAANLFVLPSRHENFGNVVIEALSCECPVILSDKVGLHREITASNTGWVLPRKAQAWTDLIRNLIQKNEPFKETGIRGRNWVRAEMSNHKAALKMSEFYLEQVAKCDSSFKVSS
jgi:glycosyltransferase involved in cell wall biosynthesis